MGEPLEDTLRLLEPPPDRESCPLKRAAAARHALQKTCYLRIAAAEAYAPTKRIRHCYARWQLAVDPVRRDTPSGFRLEDDGHGRWGPRVLTPDWIDHRVLDNLRRLQRLVAPRVCGAVLRTIFNGWHTARRRSLRHSAANHCVLCAGDMCEDAIEHYCRDPLALRLARGPLRLPLTPASARHWMMLCAPSLSSDEDLVCTAVWTYAVFRTVCLLRDQPNASADYKWDLLGEYTHVAVQGHAASCHALDGRWCRASDRRGGA